jgi:hypothetical protein
VDCLSFALGCLHWLELFGSGYSGIMALQLCSVCCKCENPRVSSWHLGVSHVR